MALWGTRKQRSLSQQQQLSEEETKEPHFPNLSLPFSSPFLPLPFSSPFLSLLFFSPSPSLSLHIHHQGPGKGNYGATALFLMAMEEIYKVNPTGLVLIDGS